jgi:serine/threonine-protein kinase
MESTHSHHNRHHPDTAPFDSPADLPGGDLTARYRAILTGADPDWADGCRDLRLVGRGGQGVVFFARHEGADGFVLPISLKVFSPETYRTPTAYGEDMARVAAVAARVAEVQHENLVAVHDFVSLAGVRVMRLEWVDGLDLRQVLSQETLNQTRARLTAEHLRFVEDVILTGGPNQPRLKPGVAIHILRDCLGALAALHRDAITHGDLKPSNVVLAGGAVTPQSDLASLGYVLIEMLAGRSPFDGAVGIAGLLEAKQSLERRLPDVLPAEVAGSELLMSLCRRLVTADPDKRFPDAEAADLGRKGAAAFHRQLVKGDLASEYGNDLRVWLEALGPLTGA